MINSECCHKVQLLYQLLYYKHFLYVVMLCGFVGFCNCFIWRITGETAILILKFNTRGVYYPYIASHSYFPCFIPTVTVSDTPTVVTTTNSPLTGNGKEG